MGSSKQADMKKTLDEDYYKTLPGADARTSNYYAVENVPERFDNPGPVGDKDVINNSGNPVFSCPKSLDYLAAGELQSDSGDSFKGYQTRPQHPMYMTSSNDYGSRKPTVHTMPKSFHAKSQKFSEPLGKCGMYRNHSLNTAVDKSKVSSHLDGLF